MKSLCWMALVAALGIGGLGAAEFRTWTSRKGSVVEAQLVKADARQVQLLTKENRTLNLKTEDLSLADRQYLVEYGGADESVIEGGDLGEPENEVRINSKTFKKLEEPLALDPSGQLAFELLETPHFLIASDGVRPQPMAETAERMWHGMAFEHMNFRADWGDKRRIIFLVEEPENWAALGKWYEQLLIDNGVEQEVVASVSKGWKSVGGTQISLPLALCDERKLIPRASVFQVKEDRFFKKAMSPFLVHSVAHHLLAQQMGNVSEYGSTGYFAISTGFAYFKEIKLTGKTETVLLDSSGTEDEISSKKGFKDGTSWAKTLRGMVRRDKVTPKFEEMLGWKIQDLDAEKLVLIYSFAYYCNSTPKLVTGFARLIRRVESSNQIPEPIEFARLMGFESVEELEKGWTEFVKSTQFK